MSFWLIFFENQRQSPLERDEQSVWSTLKETPATDWLKSIFSYFIKTAIIRLIRRVDASSSHGRGLWAWTRWDPLEKMSENYVSKWRRWQDNERENYVSERRRWHMTEHGDYVTLWKTSTGDWVRVLCVSALQSPTLIHADSTLRRVSFRWEGLYDCTSFMETETMWRHRKTSDDQFDTEWALRRWWRMTIRSICTKSEWRRSRRRRVSWSEKCRVFCNFDRRLTSSWTWFVMSRRSSVVDTYEKDSFNERITDVETEWIASSFVILIEKWNWWTYKICSQ